MARSRNYKNLLIESLKDPQEAQAYFHAILEECQDCDESEAQQLLRLALNNLAASKTLML